MNAAKAKRRWIAWCRYVEKTDTRTKPSFAGLHQGHTKAYQDLMFAGRAYPQGARWVYYPKWGIGQ